MPAGRSPAIWPGRHVRRISFYQLVGAREHGPPRRIEAESLGGLEIDHQLVLHWRLHREVGRLLALEDAVDVAGRLPVLVDVIRPIRSQATRGGRKGFAAGAG